MQGGTTAEEIVELLVNLLEEYMIPLENIIVVSTDGCATMLGVDNGVHTLLRRKIPHLPAWGGCTCHDCSNLLKAAFNKLAPGLTKVYSTWHSYLSSLSLHRKREYEAYCEEEGLEPHAIPAMCDTRFRMNIRFAQWMEKDDRCLYLCATRLRDDVESGKKKDMSEAETIILKDFLGNYLVVRLVNMFFLEVSSPVLTLLNFLETEEPLIYKRWDMMAELFYDMFSKFMKSDRAENIPTELLDVVFTNLSLQHSDTEIFLGAKRPWSFDSIFPVTFARGGEGGRGYININIFFL